MPIYVSGTFCIHTAGNYHNSTAFFHPMNKFGAVISFISQNQFSGQINGLQQRLRHTNIMTISAGKQKTQRIPKPIRHRMDLCCQSSPAAPGFFAPFLAPLACWCTLTVVLSSINVVSSAKSSVIKADKTSSHTPASVHVRNRL